LAVAIWGCACSSLMAQPLEPGLRVGQDRRVVLDDGVLRVFSADFQDLPGPKSSERIQAVYQAPGWENSLLVLRESGLARLDSTSEQQELQELIAGKDLKVLPWGEQFLTHAGSGQQLLVLGPSSEQSLELPGQLLSLEVLSPELALLHTEQGMFALRQPSRPELSEMALPFPAAEARIAHHQGRAVLWSPQSQQLVDLRQGLPAQGGANLSLPELPLHGVRVLQDGSVIAAGRSNLLWIPLQGAVQRFPAPAPTDEASIASWPMLGHQGKVWLLFEGEDGPRLAHYPAPGPTQKLPAGTFRGFVAPSPDQLAAQPLLFWETELEEVRIDQQGRRVLDLHSGLDASPRGVTGHQILVLDNQGPPRLVVDQPRARLVGPVQLIGGRAVYATQTEPAQEEGQKLTVNLRFPYPPVQLWGRSLVEPSEAWSFDKPRGETPSKDRIPSAAWPVAADGSLLITSEGNRLLAIDPADGALRWSSPKLSLDESAPPMLSWPDDLALVATKGTTRTLLVLDAQNGSLQHTVALTDFFFWDRWRHLIGVLVLCFSLAYYIYAAGKRQLYIRKIAGLQALDEAVGRATEMGKPVLYVVGLADVEDIQTMASLSILSYVARKTAEYDTPIITTTSRPVAFASAQEIVRDAFSVAGRPDAFSVESVRYISDDQFGYTAGVDGIMVREKPAANFYIGNFYAESLILAETGYATGSIQMAGTSQVSQIPFFVAACDYTLIGEELFAASAYLSRDPLQVGSLRGQDVGKALVMVMLILCSLLDSLGYDWAWINTQTGWNLP
jgi:hypothetical protein